ncbi:hypothetical protein GPECTOR_1g57 [Gonium pectorale]|uniref:Glycosyltransferase family 61 protein n=1 Tax=Gonium pectorale TaxID=33097 RepID=A0A150H3N9_GONPE|nr:hypothetical protein GPECTOR_1g57 [Gonium pectorale]|eukprot:KXZ56632.1 hypothetical protein GPECTOR_1g57 [Gonium pectorale]
MPPYYAPCLSRALPALEYGEELVYPDFEAALPGFFDHEDAAAWINNSFGPDAQGQTGGNRRAVVDMSQGRVAFIGLRGQNLVFKNVRYQEGIVPTTWVGDSSHCLGHMTRVTQWRESLSEEEMQRGAANRSVVRPEYDEIFVEEAAIYVTPDSDRRVAGARAYQHWLDHTVKPIVQSAHLITNKTKVVPGAVRRRSAADTTRLNAGRSIVNEEEVKDAIRKLLDERNLGERLEVHPPSQAFPSPLDYARWLNRNVAAMLGPHGGGLCNFKWLSANTLVLEFMPRNWLNSALWDEAVGHGLNYWVDVRPPVDDLRNMAANITRIIALLKAELGKEPSRGPIIRHRYDWPAAMDDAIGTDPRFAPYFKTLQGHCCGASASAGAGEGIHVLNIPPVPEPPSNKSAHELLGLTPRTRH